MYRGGALISLAFVSSLSGATPPCDPDNPNPANCTVTFDDNDTFTDIGILIDTNTSIPNVTLNFGNNTTIDSRLTIANSNLTSGTASGTGIENLKVTFENNTTTNPLAPLIIASTHNSDIRDTTVTFGNDTKMNNRLYGANAYGANNISNTTITFGDRTIAGNGSIIYGALINNEGNISNTKISLGNDANIKILIGAQIGDAGNIDNTTITFGNNARINDVLIGAEVNDAGDISNTKISFGDSANITNLTGAKVSYTGDIDNTTITFANDAVINGDLTGAEIGNAGNIDNTTITLGNDTVINGNLYVALINNEGNISNTKISFGNDANITNLFGIITPIGNIDNTTITFGNNARINDFLIGAQIGNNGNISNTKISLGNDAVINSDLIGTRIGDDGNIDNTTITLSDNATIGNDLIGAEVIGAGNIRNTTITLGNNARINGVLIGAQIGNNGNISNTKISLGNNARINDFLIGTRIGDDGNIDNTTITLSDNATIGNDLIGAEVIGAGNIRNTTITLNGTASVGNFIIGGKINSGEVSGSKIYIHGNVNNTTQIIGGLITTNDLNLASTSKAINNLIHIDTDTEINMPDAVLTGGFSTNQPAADVLSGNKLYFSGKKGVFKDIANFETIEINAGSIATTATTTGLINAAAPITPIDPIITLTGTNSTDLSKTNISLLLSADSNIKDIAIIKKDNGTITAPKSATASVLKGVSTVETFSLNIDGNNTLSASWVTTAAAQEKTQNVGTAAISESESLLAGNDVIDLVFLGKSIKSNTLETFGMIRGGNIETTSGANTNTKTINLIAGVGKSINENTQYGIFFEGGYGNYNSSTDTPHGISNGEGSSSYYGAGLLLSYNLTQSMYLESSLRLGQIKTSYASDNLGLEATPLSARFNTTKLYYGGHLGLGNLFEISQDSNIDLYVKAYYGRIGQDDVRLATGENLSFQALNSLITKLGARYNYNIASNFALYGGGSYEYEVLGDIKTLNKTADISYKTLRDRKDSFAIEAGTQILPTSSDNLVLNVHAKYLIGARSGVAGSLKAMYKF